MGQIDSYIHLHPYACFAALWAFTNMVLYMPPPEPKSSKFYQWVFAVLHAMAGAIPRIASNFLPADSIIGKALSGGNGFTNGNTPSTSGGQANPQTKVDGAPPSSSEKPR